MDDEPKCYCGECGEGCDDPVHGGYCSEECAAAAGVDTRPLAERWAEWASDISYRSGIDYACGYHD